MHPTSFTAFHPPMSKPVTFDQELYFPDNCPAYPRYFKGMKCIIHEHGLWPKTGLLAQCEKFKCKPGQTSCCCQWLLFMQPDFISHKSQLEELITSQGEICDIYPKFHYESNFIKQYWGAVKFWYHNTPKTSNMKEMEENVVACLDDISLLQIQ